MEKKPEPRLQNRVKDYIVDDNDLEKFEFEYLFDLDSEFIQVSKMFENSKNFFLFVDVGG